MRYVESDREQVQKIIEAALLALRFFGEKNPRQKDSRHEVTDEEGFLLDILFLAIKYRNTLPHALSWE